MCSNGVYLKLILRLVNSISSRLRDQIYAESISQAASGLYSLPMLLYID